MFDGVEKILMSLTIEAVGSYMNKWRGWIDDLNLLSRGLWFFKIFR